MMAIGHSLLVLSLLLGGDADAADASPLGKTIESFQLRDYLGAEHALDDWRDKQAVVVVFTGAECPLAKLYGPRLAELAERFKPRGVQFVAIDSNQQDTLAEIAHYARVHKISFPVLKDAGNRVADQFGAIRTPEAFLLDKERVVRYWGAIDDQYGVGYARAQVQQDYLGSAIEELLSGKPISTPVTKAVGCYIGRVERGEPTGDITYASHVAGILNKNCVGCHRPGQIAPFSLTAYDDVVGWAETIREVIEDRRMPPWHANPNHGQFANDARMADEEKRQIFEWVENGVPEGDPSQTPPLPEFTEGWRIPEPDVVIRMPRPFKVPAKGVVPYQYFYVDPGFKEDVWIRGAEGRPGNNRVVHHLILFYLPPGQDRPRPEDPLVNAIASFSPGQPAAIGPDQYARRIPAGSKLVFQLHYTPNGSEQIDQSEAGLVLADRKKVEKEILVTAAVNWQFRIPPGESNHRVEARHRFNQDTELYALIPHMHLRGKSFRFTAIYPDKREEILLDVPRYDFNWQNVYLLAEPKLMPEGTELHCVGHFDNSAENLVNPDPTKPVYWGDQTWEEMLVGSFYYALAEQDLSLGAPRATKRDDGRYDVRFSYRPTIECKDVFLAGEFNKWKPNGLKMNGPDDAGFHSTTVDLPAGRYEYKFVLDGKTWKHDPGNREQAGFYNNSVVWVGPRDEVGKTTATKKVKPKFTISKETTYVTEPLTKAGYPDFAAALNQRHSRDVTADNNANVLLWRAHGPHPEKATMPPEFFKLMGIEAPPEDGEYYVHIFEYLTERKGLKRDEEEFKTIFGHWEKAMDRPWKSAEFPEVAEWLRANEKPLAIVGEAAKRPKYFSPVVIPEDSDENYGLIGVLLPAVQASREFARSLVIRAHLHMAEGRAEEAWQDLLTCHRLGRHIGQGPFLVEKLVGIAIDGMAEQGVVTLIDQTHPTAELALRYLRELNSLPPRSSMAEGVDITERLVYVDSTLLIARGGERSFNALMNEELPESLKKMPVESVDWDVVLRTGNQWYDRIAEAMQDKQRSERMKKLDAISQDLKALAAELKDPAKVAELLKDPDRKKTAGDLIGRALIALLMPGVSAVQNAEDRAEQRHHNLHVALALAAYRSDQAAYPQALADLSPKYLKEVPDDLFSGKSLVYRPAKDGYLLYSVGPNGKDDDGRYYDDEPSGDDHRIRIPVTLKE